MNVSKCQSIAEFMYYLMIPVDNNTSVQDAILHKLHSSCTDLHETLVGMWIWDLDEYSILIVNYLNAVTMVI